jgi:hypothetical protein
MKKYWAFIAFFIFQTIFLFSHGKVELPVNYINLDEIIISPGEKNYDLLLPYVKPDGIDRIYTNDTLGIIIHQIIGDDKLILPKRQYFSNNEVVAMKRERSVDYKREILEFGMKWFALGAKITDEIIGKGLFYETLDDKKNIHIYNIPYGTIEIYITYSIQFPQKLENQKLERKTIYFRINWPKINAYGSAQVPGAKFRDKILSKTMLCYRVLRGPKVASQKPAERAFPSP